jgi:uncharacterized protein YjbI with pentapeptide repeats
MKENPMANRKHLTVLKMGVDAWNTWRAKHPELRPDFSRVNLVAARLSGAHLDHANFHGANLEKAALESTNLRGAILRGANLRQASLSGAILTKATLLSPLNGGSTKV